jgi:anti-sigma factor RsiW
MSEHLNEEQMAAAVAELPLEEAAQEHLANCVSCKGQLTEMRQLIEERRLEMAAGSPNWETLQERVFARIGETAAPRPRRRWLRGALAAAAAIAIAVGVGLLQRPGEVEPESEIAIEEILAEAEELLGNDSIPGFELIDPGIEELQVYYDNGNGVS